MKKLIVFLIFLWIPLAQAEKCRGDRLVALEDITNCAEQGDRVAQYMLGQIYFHGKEVPRNYKKAFEWSSKAAEQGDKDAQAQLGFDYYNGWGVPKDHVLAYMWWSLSIVNQNDPVTQINLDNLEGELTSNELAKAQKMASDWLTKHPAKKY